MPAAEIRVRLPDGSVKALPAGATAADLAKAIGPGLAKAALAAKVNGEVRDLARPLPDGVAVELLTDKHPQALDVLRHSSAHVLATAVRQLFPHAKIGFGPPIEDGFYYDFEVPTPFTPEDLARIEAKMVEVTAADYPFVREEVNRAEAKRRFTDGTGAATSAARCCSAFTARRGSPRTTLRRTFGGSRRRANATIAGWGASSTSSCSITGLPACRFGPRAGPR